MKRIAIGTDHAGYELKETLKVYLQKLGYKVEDFGTNSANSVDYPDFIRPAAESVASGRNDLGIVLGGSGNGEAIVANKITGIRCGLCWDLESARLTKEHNNANVIAIGARMVSAELATGIVETWLKTDYEVGRHNARIAKIEPQ
ncbi:MAG: ribose 5-phosphate isomerase B [Opitutaceae bacterium]|nr:ribose 5-phosphate isomerase B [Opitutaceae bacterium]